ncbi:stage III sporulation protein AE [Virgibacillus sp. W0430]|uniref:stage III sporulation protein AE n=1 Tax=Virgibacillus sp. W0430 TaxID=3391580 RepID=UPI003F46BE13
MKRFKSAHFVVLLTITVLFIPSVSVKANDGSEQVEESLLEDISLEPLQTNWQSIVRNYGGYIPEINKTSIKEMIINDGTLSIKTIFSGMMKFLFHELIVNGKLLGLLIMLTLFSTILQTMHTTFEQSTVSKIAYFIVYIVLIFIALNSFHTVFSYTKTAIDTMSSFLIGLLPLVLGLMATFGNLITVSFFHPIVMFLIHLSGVLISSFILPLLYLSAILIIVSSLNDNYKVTHLANLLKSISLGTLGLFLTIFIGVMSVQGAASAIQDGVAMKTTKFITGNFIPVVGRTFTDAADTVFSASLLLKNAVGIVGVTIIVLLAIFPAIKIFAIAVIYKLAAAILQPVGDGPIIYSLNVISKYIVYILACLLAVTLMFFLAIVFIVAASNVTLLLR